MGTVEHYKKIHVTFQHHDYPLVVGSCPRIGLLMKQQYLLYNFTSSEGALDACAVEEMY